MRSQKRTQRQALLALLAAAGLALPISAARADLIGEWNFDNQDLTETSLHNPTGVHDGLAYGTVTFSTDTPLNIGGYSVDLTAGNSAVLVNNSNYMVNGSAGGGVNANYLPTYDAAIANGPMAISVWAKGQPPTWEPYVAEKGESGNGYQLRRYSTSNSTTFTLRGTAGNDDPGPGVINSNNDGQWHNYVGVWDPGSGNRYTYVDGVLDPSSSILDHSDTGMVAAATYEYLTFGARDFNGSIQGFSNVKLDDVRIYNSVLTAADIHAITNRDLTASDSIGASLGGVGSASGFRAETLGSANAGINSLAEADGLLSGATSQPGGQTFAGSVSKVNFSSTGGDKGLFAGDTNFPAGSGDNMVTSWSGVLDIQTAGDYVFGVNSDDGFRLTIAGKVVSEFDAPTGGSDQRVGLTFDQAGLYRFTLEHFNGGGDNNVEFWAKPGTDSTIDASAHLVGDTASGGIAVYQNVLTAADSTGGTAIAAGTGTHSISASYAQRDGYTVASLAQGEDLLTGAVNPSRTQIEARGSINNVGVPTTFGGDNFGGNFTGVMNITTAGEYTFTTASDDGFRLIIGGQVVSEANYPKGTNAITNLVNFLSPGVYEYTLQWFEKGGGQSITLTATDPSANAVDLYGLAGDNNVAAHVRTGFHFREVKLASGQLGGSLDNIDEARQLLAHADLYGSSVATGFVDTVNFLDGGSDGNFGGGIAPPITGDQYALSADGSVYITNAGFWTFGVNVDDGALLTIGGNASLERYGVGGAGDVLATVFFDHVGWYDLNLTWFESGGGSEVELFAAQGAYTAFDSMAFHLVGDTAHGGLQVMTVPAPAALPAGLALLAAAGFRRRRRA